MQLTENKTLLRNIQNYEHDVALNDKTMTGIKGPCPLNEMDNFHVTWNRAPDIMHDILEGICPLEVKLVLYELIRKGCFTSDTLNARITSFNYGLADAKNKPCPIPWSSLRSADGVVRQKAGSMYCLVRHMPLLLGDLVQEDDEH
jgi:hypothetical protein